MKKSWAFTDVNGVEHSIVYKNGFSNKLIIDGNQYKVKSQNWFLNVLDYSIEIAGSDIRLVVIGTKADVAINGVYIGSGEKYVPVQANTPGYVWVLVGISILGGYFVSGLIGMLIGILISTSYVKNALNKNTKAVVGLFIGCTLIQIVICVIAVVLRASTGY